MTIPTQQTLDTLTVEGLKRAGHHGESAGTALQTRAEGWVEEIKWDVWSSLQGRKLKCLMATAYGVTTDGISRYALPDDFAEFYNVTILDGTHTGTCQSGSTTSSIVLAAAEDIDEDTAQGKMLLITGGTGIGGCSEIDTYTVGTVTATLTPSLNTSAPTSGSTYMIVDKNYPLIEKEIRLRDIEPYPYSKDIPKYYFPIGQAVADSDETGEFVVMPTPDDTYGVQLRYYVNLTLTDLTSNLMATLYRRWANLWIQGVLVRCLQHDRASMDKYTTELKVYQHMLERTVANEPLASGLSNLTMTVTD